MLRPSIQSCSQRMRRIRKKDRREERSRVFVCICIRYVYVYDIIVMHGHKSNWNITREDPNLGDSRWHKQSKLRAWPAQACQEIRIPLTIEGGGRSLYLIPLVFLGRLVLAMHPTLIGHANVYFPNQDLPGYPGLLIWAIKLLSYWL